MDIDSSATDGRRSDEVQEEKQNFHVLAVDDSNLDRKLLERLLTVSSYQVTCVDSGDKALEYLGLLDNIEDNVCEGSSPSPPPPLPPPLSSLSSSMASAAGLSSPKSPQQEISKVSLIMTDYSMPGINGYDLLKRIKDSSWKDVPVVVMSSENVPSRINMCLEGGAEEFLLKPVKLSDLRKLHSHLLKYSISHPCKPRKSDEDDSVSSIENALNVNIEDSESDSNCSNANKRKATPSDLSDRRPRVQELPVS